jgi:hypothetical protein
MDRPGFLVSAEVLALAFGPLGLRNASKTILTLL